MSNSTDTKHSGLNPWFAAGLVITSALMMAGHFIVPTMPSAVWSLTPLYAAGMLFGAQLGTPRGAALVVVTQLAGCLAIGFVSGRLDYAFYGWNQLTVFGAMLAAPLVGHLLLSRSRGIARRIGGGLATAIVFYLITNFGVWFTPAADVAAYPKTWEGLVACYVAAIPFLRTSIFASVGYALLLFSDPVLSLATRRDSETTMTESTVA